MNTKIPKLAMTGTTCIWGQSESGKSYLARQMIDAANPAQLVVIDPQSDVGTDAHGVLAALLAGDKVVICNDSRKHNKIGAIIFALNHATPDTPVYVVADEAPSYMKEPRDSLSHAILQGRHAGFGMLIIGQRPASVFAEYRTQAKATYWLRLQDHTDVDTARKQIGPENAEKIKTFKQGEYIKWPPNL